MPTPGDPTAVVRLFLKDPGPAGDVGERHADYPGEGVGDQRRESEGIGEQPVQADAQEKRQAPEEEVEEGLLVFPVKRMKWR